MKTLLTKSILALLLLTSLNAFAKQIWNEGAIEFNEDVYKDIDCLYKIETNKNFHFNSVFSDDYLTGDGNESIDIHMLIEFKSASSGKLLRTYVDSPRIYGFSNYPAIITTLIPTATVAAVGIAPETIYNMLIGADFENSLDASFKGNGPKPAIGVYVFFDSAIGSIFKLVEIPVTYFRANHQENGALATFATKEYCDESIN